MKKKPGGGCSSLCNLGPGVALGFPSSIPFVLDHCSKTGCQIWTQLKQSQGTDEECWPCLLRAGESRSTGEGGSEVCPTQNLYSELHSRHLGNLILSRVCKSELFSITSRQCLSCPGMTWCIDGQELWWWAFRLWEYWSYYLLSPGILCKVKPCQFHLYRFLREQWYVNFITLWSHALIKILWV